MAELKLLTDRGSFTREVADFPEGISDDGVLGYTIGAKKYVRTEKGKKFKSEHIGIWANGSDMTEKLQSRLNHSSVKVIELDSDAGDILINGAVTIPSGKVLKISEGTKITGTGTITGGTIEANLNSHIFDSGITANFSSAANGEISPIWWGAVGNNVVDCSPAFQKMWNWVGSKADAAQIRIPPGKYYHATQVNLPLAIGSANRIVVLGYSATLRTDAAIKIWNRLPATTTEANNTISDWKLSLKGLRFEGSGVAGQVGLAIGSMYQAHFEELYFKNLDVGSRFEFILGGSFSKFVYENCYTDNFVGSYGSSWGGTTANSAFNACKLDTFRVFGRSGAQTHMKLVGTSGTSLKNFISEGSRPVSNIYIDDFGSTNVLNKSFENIYFESTGGATAKSILFHFKDVRHNISIRNAESVYGDFIFKLEAASNPAHITFDGCAFFVYGTPCFDAGGLPWAGRNITFSNDRDGATLVTNLFDPAKWVGGVVMSAVHAIGSNGATGDFRIHSSSNIILSGNKGAADNANSKNVFFEGTLKAITDNIYGFGGRIGQNARPKFIFVGDGGIYTHKSSSIKWGSGVAGDEPDTIISRAEADVARFEGTKAIELPIGTTAQRPTNAARRLRYNSTTGLVEWNNGTTWLECVSLTSTQSLTNKTLGTGTKIDLGTVAVGDIYYGAADGTLIRLPKGTDGTVLKIVAGVPAWADDAVGGLGEPSIRSTAAATDNFLITDDTLLVDTTAGNVAITIDNLTSKRVRYIKKISTDANTVTITPALGTIDGAANHVLDAANEVLAFQRFESNYYTLNK